MSFTEQIQIEINTVFDASGFKQLRRNMASVSEKFEAMGQFFRQAKGMSNMIQEAREFEQILDQANLRFDQLNDKRKGGDLQEQRVKGMVGGSGIFSKGDTEAIMEMGGIFRDVTGESIRMGEALRRVGAIISDFQMRGMQFPDQLRDPGTILGEGFDTQQFQMPNIQESIQDMPNISAEDLGPGTRGFPTEQTTKMDKLRNRFQSVKAASSNVAGGLRKGAAGARAFSGALTGVMGSALSSVTPSVQNLQMKLLGLQFTMLTIAFLFGGLATGALGAVGVFETLSNTLKFLFLPSALNVLDSVLKLQEFIFGLSRPFREAIGNASLTVAAFASIVSVAAILGKAILSVIGPLATLAGFLGGPLTLLLAVAGALGLIAFRGSLAAKEGSKLNSFLKTAGNLASKLFKFTGKAAAKLGQFLGKMFANIGQFFMNANWGEIWSDFFNFASNARNKAGTFLEDTFNKFKKASKNTNWSQVWKQFYDFTGEGIEEANDFLTDTINRFATWAADEADWEQIWEEFFDFKRNAANAFGRFIGQILAGLVNFFAQLNLKKIAKAIRKGDKARAKELLQNNALTGESLVMQEITTGIASSFSENLELGNSGGPDVQPQNGTTQNKTNNLFQVSLDTTINGKNNTTKEDVREMESELQGFFLGVPSSTVATGGGNR